MQHVLNDLRVIDLTWDGPFALDQVRTTSGNHQCGVYAIYGTHNVMGTDALLYIGRADPSFANRFGTHKEVWMDYEPGEQRIYLGHVSGTQAISESDYPQWSALIADAEALLIYHCSPPYNSSGIAGLRDMPLSLVVNHGRRHRLPALVGDIYRLSPYYQNLKPLGLASITDLGH
jgi:hypothetical protein